MSALSNRNPNAQPMPNPFVGEKQVMSGAENKQEKTQQHKQMLESELGVENGKLSGAYVSPSDAIMSPASQKLAGFKQRQLNKQQNGKNSTSRLLFARTPSSCSSGSDDVDTSDEKVNEK